MIGLLPVRHVCVVLMVTMGLLLMAPPGAQASNDTLLKLLRILHDRGSITAEEYEELRRSAERPESPTSPESPTIPQSPTIPERPGSLERASNAHPLPVPGAAADESPTVPEMPVSAPAAPPVPAAVQAAADPAGTPQPPALMTTPAESIATRVRALEEQAARQDTEVIRKALANKWYERIGLRGYTQFRFSEVAQGEGPDLEVPADRSVNPNESFIIRRGRFVFSGDVSDRLALYAQSDFNASTGAADFSLQMRDLYADVALDRNKAFRVRLGQSKVPFGWVNMQSSQNRAPVERPDALNSAAEGERDLGMYLMWAPREVRQRFRDLVSQGLKGSGDYGVVAVGLFSGQGLNRADQNGEPHVIARWSYPFRLASGQFLEVGAQAYRGKFVSATQSITAGGATFTPARAAEGVTDERVAVSAIWYPQPFGVEAEWNVGRGPELSDDLQRIDSRSLSGGYVQLNYRHAGGTAAWFPFVRWQYYEGGRKFARNAPHMRVNEMDLGLEVAQWAELELTLIYTRTFERTRTSLFPYASSRDANRLAFQVQWNY